MTMAGTGTDMPPPPARTPGSSGPRKRKPEVLEEDDYTTALEAIVERDFFPDLPKLQNKLEWLQATNSGDPLLIRQAQMKIAARSQRRMANMGAATPLVSAQGDVAATPSGFSTPGSVRGAGGETPGIRGTPMRGGPAGTGVSFEEDPEAAVPNMGIDEFLSKYTSEDNASFAEIVETANEKVRHRRAALIQSEGKEESAREAKAIEGGRACDGYGTTGAPDARVATWKHNEDEVRSFFHSNGAEGLPMSKEQLAAMAKGAPKAIAKANTRFIGPPGGAALQSGGATPDLRAMLATPMVNVGGIIQPMGTPGRGGAYQNVVTPSPAPGVDESPFMTWGDIDSTPMRLDMEDTPVDIGGGRFKVPAVPAREKVNRRLTATPKTGAMRTPTRGGGPGSTPGRAGSGLTPGRAGSGLTPGRGGARTPGSAGKTVPLSPALQKMVEKARLKQKASRGGLDFQLRASYSGTPKRTPGGTPVGRAGAAGTPLGGASLAVHRTPVGAARAGGSAGTPMRSPAPSPAPRSAAAGAGGAEKTGKGGGLTDGLLDI